MESIGMQLFCDLVTAQDNARDVFSLNSRRRTRGRTHHYCPAYAAMASGGQQYGAPLRRQQSNWGEEVEVAAEDEVCVKAVYYSVRHKSSALSTPHLPQGG